MNKNSKTSMKKNKLQISWPTGRFSIKNLQEQHPKAKNITLRFRVNKALAKKEIVRVGQTAGQIGRPTLYFARAEDPVVQQLEQDAARAAASPGADQKA